MSQVRPKAERVGEIAAKVVVQLLFATGKSFTVDGLREKLREFYREEVRPELRAVAALNNVELITALISCNRQLGLVGLQLRILNGVVSLLTTEVQNKALGAYLANRALRAQIFQNCHTESTYGRQSKDRGKDQDQGQQDGQIRAGSSIQENLVIG